MFNVLVLCTANSARSILAEAVLNRAGKGRIHAFSAGSHPRGSVNPLAIEVLKAHGHATGGLRSKSWDEFAAAGAPVMDLVITVCDAAAGEACPMWNGAPLRVHWGMPDPAGVPGGLSAERAAFAKAYDTLHERMTALAAFQAENLTREELAAALDAIVPRDAA